MGQSRLETDVSKATTAPSTLENDVPDSIFGTSELSGAVGSASVEISSKVCWSPEGCSAAEGVDWEGSSIGSDASTSELFPSIFGEFSTFVDAGSAGFSSTSCATSMSAASTVAAAAAAAASLQAAASAAAPSAAAVAAASGSGASCSSAAGSAVAIALLLTLPSEDDVVEASTIETSPLGCCPSCSSVFCPSSLCSKASSDWFSSCCCC
mmetsp:Transcript_91577/g.200736  ORF Transcript_91577/g.200736 Transcript_91577/m.200736 type:complete len:210 (+) Transcript_91577:706-1335(+)